MYEAGLGSSDLNYGSRKRRKRTCGEKKCIYCKKKDIDGTCDLCNDGLHVECNLNAVASLSLSTSAPTPPRGMSRRISRADHICFSCSKITKDNVCMCCGSSSQSHLFYKCADPRCPNTVHIYCFEAYRGSNIVKLNSTDLFYCPTCVDRLRNFLPTFPEVSSFFGNGYTSATQFRIFGRMRHTNLVIANMIGSRVHGMHFDEKELSLVNTSKSSTNTSEDFSFELGTREGKVINIKPQLQSKGFSLLADRLADLRQLRKGPKDTPKSPSRDIFAESAREILRRSRDQKFGHSRFCIETKSTNNFNTSCKRICCPCKCWSASSFPEEFAGPTVKFEDLTVFSWGWLFWDLRKKIKTELENLMSCRDLTKKAKREYIAPSLASFADISEEDYEEWMQKVPKTSSTFILNSESDIDLVESCIFEAQSPSSPLSVWKSSSAQEGSWYSALRTKMSQKGISFTLPSIMEDILSLIDRIEELRTNLNKMLDNRGAEFGSPQCLYDIFLLDDWFGLWPSADARQRFFRQLIDSKEMVKQLCSILLYRKKTFLDNLEYVPGLPQSSNFAAKEAGMKAFSVEDFVSVKCAKIFTSLGIYTPMSLEVHKKGGAFLRASQKIPKNTIIAEYCGIVEPLRWSLTKEQTPSDSIYVHKIDIY
eukprot:GHVP01034916.1.p1 GENE.GHVP01034916.1~~GHVP01034916.1.p1  ORF type:complete len:650 (+),score=94.10 GHVP01034916.1:78-2027(+)